MRRSKTLYDLYNSFFLVTFCIVVVLTFKYYNKNRELERHYHSCAKPAYITMMTCYTIVVMALWFHVQYIIMRISSL